MGVDFDEFDEISAKQWKQKIQFDLKGIDYTNLLHHTPEGIDIKPFYHADDLKIPFIPTDNDRTWTAGNHITLDHTENGLNAIQKAVQHGTDFLYLQWKNGTVDYQEILRNIPSDTTIHIEAGMLDVRYWQQLHAYCQENAYNVTITVDPIHHWLRTGNWYDTQKKDWARMDLLQQSIVQENTSAFYVDMTTYQNAGATLVQQIAYGLNHALEYADHFDDYEQSPLINTPILFKVAIGSHYFLEIAKIRALRRLWSQLAELYDIHSECRIIAMPTLRNKDDSDSKMNIIRSSTEVMSALLGKVDQVVTIPYDSTRLDGEVSDSGIRISQNQLHILEQESYWKDLPDVVSGSYYIESLTHQLAEGSLRLFHTIEKGGGLIKQIYSGTLQRKIKEAAQKEQDQFRKKESQRIGMNMYRVAERKNELSLLRKNVRTAIEPIVTKRLQSEDYTQKMTLYSTTSSSKENPKPKKNYKKF